MTHQLLTYLVADPAACVGEQEEPFGPEVHPWRHPDGWQRTDEALAVFVERDCVVDCRLGAHPYLLWSFADAVWIQELPRAEFVRWFKDGTAKIGFRGFAV